MKAILRIDPDRAHAVPGKSIARPISPEARRRAAQNKTHNAELAEMIVLRTESVPGFIELFSQLQEELQPESCIESTFVDAMAAAHWHRMRYWLIEKTLTAPGFPAASGRKRLSCPKQDRPKKMYSPNEPNFGQPPNRCPVESQTRRSG